MGPFYLYTCNSGPCRGAHYAVTEPPLSCPYCDQGATEEKPTAEIIYMSVNKLPEKTDK